MNKSKTFSLATVAGIFALLTSQAGAQTFSVQSAGDFGGAHPNYPASNVIDGNTAFASRWAANYNNSGNGVVNLFVDLGSVKRVDDIGVAWGRGDSRSYNFEVRARSGTSGKWTKIKSRTDSSGNTRDVEVYNVDDFDARQVRVKVFSTSNGSSWADVTEFEVYGTSGPSGGNSGGDSGGGDNGGGGDSGGGTGQFGLDPSADPWDNFDLSQWKLDTPASRSSSESCKTQFTEPQDWQNDFPSASGQYFFTHTDGGMRFVSEIGGATTGGSCSSRTRSELREMLRGSNTSIDTDGKTSDGDDDGDFRNNWALGYQPTTKAGSNSQSWGAREGKMRATLRVNKVTTTGSDSSRGRVVIGQIHAKDDEPLRLNYKHRAGFDGGCIYASSEQNGGSDSNFVLAGSNTSCSSDPGNNGLGLGELFSYQIENIDEDIIVTIYQGDFGNVIDTVTIDLDAINGGYDVNNDWMYFKAGAYTQNSTNDGGSSGDGDIVTFYRLDVTH